jgi:hypothetical protein
LAGIRVDHTTPPHRKLKGRSQVSWQTYFDTHDIDTGNAVDGQKMHLESLGLSLEHVIFDPASQSYGILARYPRPCHAPGPARLRVTPLAVDAAD